MHGRAAGLAARGKRAQCIGVRRFRLDGTAPPPHPIARAAAAIAGGFRPQTSPLDGAAVVAVKTVVVAAAQAVTNGATMNAAFVVWAKAASARLCVSQDRGGGRGAAPLYHHHMGPPWGPDDGQPRRWGRWRGEWEAPQTDACDGPGAQVYGRVG